MEKLEFPFTTLTDANKAFNVIPNYDAILQACPDVEHEWKQAAFALQTKGWSEERQKDAMKLFKTEHSEVARQQVEYLTAWLGSFKPSYEQKVQVGGWLMKLMFRSCPSW